MVELAAVMVIKSSIKDMKCFDVSENMHGLVFRDTLHSKTT